jgi:HlyD family secretion protein
VDAFPGEAFTGEVGKVRLNATMTQNVVTYTVEVLTDNSSGKLLPYLTANVKFIVGESKNVLIVPNTALRWQPQPNQVAAEFREKTRKPKKSQLAGTEQPVAKTEQGRKSRGTIWVPEGSQVRPLRVALGLSDGSQTEISSPELQEDLQVVMGEAETAAANVKPVAASGGGSPFVPQPLKKESSPPPPPM